MPKNIFFGNVVIMDETTKKRKIRKNIVFVEGENLNNKYLRSKALNDFKKAEKKKFKIKRLCYETAKIIGKTNY